MAVASAGWTRLDVPLPQPDPQVVRASLSVTATPTAWVDGVEYITGAGVVYPLSSVAPSKQQKTRLDAAFDTLIAGQCHPFKAFVLCYTDDANAQAWRSKNGL
jgi:hypothetical protein